MAEFEIIRRENRIGRVSKKTHCKAIKLQSKFTYIEDLQLSRFDQPSPFSLLLFSIQKENTKCLTFNLVQFIRQIATQTGRDYFRQFIREWRRAGEMSRAGGMLRKPMNE